VTASPNSSNTTQDADSAEDSGTDTATEYTAADFRKAADKLGETTGIDLGESATVLSTAEQQAYRELELKINDADLPARYAAPLNELAITVKTGVRVGRKSILEVLLEVLQEIRTEQATAKAEHTLRLDQWYEQIWLLMDALGPEAQMQADYRTKMENNRIRILELMESNENERVEQNRALAARTSEEDRCAVANEEFGVREALRMEDLENLAKLKSLLRGLYHKKMPKDCKKHNGIICSSQDSGWCVYIEDKPDGTPASEAQRCSCNVGFYGEMCQYRMCPGFGQGLYEADQDGVCSNRGHCNHLSGQCTCRSGFYHGPKNACEWKDAPASKNGVVDNKCSDGRGVHDKVRGICNCAIEFFGPSCQQKKCLNKNHVLYPAESANACTGHGACDMESGSCTCRAPYMHGATDAWQNERCPEDCRGRGGCDHSTGACTCNVMPDEHRRFRAAAGHNINLDGKGYHGHACEFEFCPTLIQGDCSSGGGTCNRNAGLCVCREGASGPVCAKTHRCEKMSLFNDHMNWWTIWDKPGWLVCPRGQLLYKLRRSQCATLNDATRPEQPVDYGGALSCVESGGCAAPCEGGNDVAQIRHCYHDLRWYNSFDVAGWSKCLDDYFVTGLYRSCESLYCLNMAKCCSLKDSRWIKCGSQMWGAEFSGESDAQLVGTVPVNTFITGFKRGEGHALVDIEEASYCEFVRGY